MGDGGRGEWSRNAGPKNAFLPFWQSSPRKGAVFPAQLKLGHCFEPRNY